MLEYIRRNAGSWLLRIVLGAIVLVFVFWGIGSFTSNRLAVMATVNGQKILVRDYDIAYQNTINRYRRMFNGQIPPNLIKQLHLKDRVLDQLIANTLIEQAAHKMGIRVTRQEIRQAILEVPAFQLSGRFNLNLYKRVLANSDLTPEQFEAQVRKSLMENKLRALLFSSLTVPNDEIRSHYMYDNQQIDLKYVVFHPQSYLSKIHPSEKELKAWYKTHSKNYLTQPQIKLSYLLFPVTSYIKGIKITEKEIASYYKNHIDQYTTPERRRVSHILLKIPANATPAQINAVEQEANSIIKKLKHGASFAQMAREYSQDKLTAAKGGDLGFITKGQTVPAFDHLVFSLKKGVVGGPVRTKFGLHIVEVTKIIPKKVIPLSEVKDKIKKILLMRRANAAAMEAAQSAYDQILQLGSLKAYVTRNKLELKSTKYFDKMHPPAFLRNDNEALTQLFALGKGELSSILKVSDGVLIAQIEDKRAPFVPPFDKVRAMVREDVVRADAVAMCQKQAQKFLDMAQKLGFKKAAASLGLKVEDTGYFKRTDKTANNKLPPIAAAFGLELTPKTPIVDHVINAGTALYVLGFGGQKPADMKDFQKAKSLIKKKLLTNKEMQMFNSWLNHLRSNAKIKIVQKP